MRHNWKKDKNGNVDEWAWDAGYHNGVYCVNCGKTVCVNCTPDYMALDDCTGSEANIVTNADRIRAMSDEELANWVVNKAPNIWIQYTDSELGLLDWLQQPAEGGRLG